MEGVWWEQVGVAGARYLPVFAEIGLAYLVGDVLTKNRAYEVQVQAELKRQVSPWNDKMKARESDELYQRILFHSIRDALLKVRKNKAYPNSWIETADLSRVTEVVHAEYRRLNSGMDFVRLVQKTQRKRSQEIREIKAPARINKVTGRRKPPKGTQNWTTASLIKDFQVRGLTPSQNYTEATLREDYEPGHDARGRWRNGAGEFFNG